MPGWIRCCSLGRCPDITGANAGFAGRVTFVRRFRFNTSRSGRAALLAGLVLGLAPGTWLRTEISSARSTQIQIIPIAYEPSRNWPAGLTIEGAWQLESPDIMFGGYSAMIIGDEGRAIAFSDRGDSLTFTLPGYGHFAPVMGEVAFDDAVRARHRDIEAATRDRASGTFWLAYEQSNTIGRFRHGPLSIPQIVRPKPMRNWSSNSGPESLVRLADGRFMVLAERNRTGLLFARDPIEPGKVEGFKASYPAEFRPTDAVQLPDGQILVLLRKVGVALPPFRSRLMIADLPQANADSRWEPHLFAQLDGPLPHENYEAMAVQRESDTVIIWLMSDDNLSAFQTTLLIKVRWRPPAP